jgi:thiamine pyridinylase
MALVEIHKNCRHEPTVRTVILVVLALLVSVQTFAANNCRPAPSRSSVDSGAQVPAGARPLRVVLYPFLPNFAAYKNWVVSHFKSAHPDIQLEIVDLTNNYYGSFNDDYVGCANADIYELDSVFLHDFALNKRIQPLPGSATIPDEQFLKNAVAGVAVSGVRYGSPHWVCGNFMFFAASDDALRNVNTLDKLKAVIGAQHVPRRGIAVDLKGKSTLGEFYLNAAVDRYEDWSNISPHIAVFDPSLESDLRALSEMCEGTACRDSNHHGTTFFAEEFDARIARALIGYSESLNGALKLALDKSKCPDAASCLHDADIDVEELPLDPKGNKTMSWVDSFTVDSRCKDQCISDASAFIQFMNEDATYMSILLDGDGIPAYLLPAKRSLYSRSDLLAKAHLYPTLQKIIENSFVPSDLGLNEELRNTGRRIDTDLAKP